MAITQRRVLKLAKRHDSGQAAGPDSPSASFLNEQPSGHCLKFQNGEPISYSFVGNSKGLCDRLRQLAPKSVETIKPVETKEDSSLQLTRRLQCSVQDLIGQNHSTMLVHTKRILSQVDRHERNQLTREQRVLERMQDYAENWQKYDQQVKRLGCKKSCLARARERQSYEFNPTVKFQSFRDDNLKDFWKLGLRNGSSRVYRHLEGMDRRRVVRNMLLKRDQQRMVREMPSISLKGRKELDQIRLEGRSKLEKEVSVSGLMSVKLSLEQTREEVFAQSLERSEILRHGLGTVKLGVI